MRVILLITFLILAGYSAFAQYVPEEERTEDKPQEEQSPEENNDEEPEENSEDFDNWKDRVFFWPSFGFSADRFQVFVNLSPTFGYRLTDKLSSGIGATYIFQQFRNPLTRNTINFNHYGGRVFSRYDLFRNLFVYSEYELINLQISPEARNNYDALLAGLGLFSSLGDKVFINAMLLYNFFYTPNDPLYGSPLVPRIGVSLGI